MTVHGDVLVKQEGEELRVETRVIGKSAMAIAGTTRALVANLVQGVTEGFERKNSNSKGDGARINNRANRLAKPGTLNFGH